MGGFGMTEGGFRPGCLSGWSVFSFSGKKKTFKFSKNAFTLGISARALLSAPMSDLFSLFKNPPFCFSLVVRS